MPQIRFFERGPAVFAAALICLASLGLARPALAEELVVVAGPATGRHSALLQTMADTATRAAAAASPTLKIIEEDDGCDPARAKGTAALIVDKKPSLVIGHPCPAAAIAAAPLYAAAGIPFIALGVRHPALTSPRAGPAVFRLAGRDDRQGDAAAEALLRAAPEKRIAIIQDRTAYARSILAETTGALTRAAAPPALVLPIVAGRRDYEPEIAKLAAAKPEAILFAGYPSEAAVILRGLRKAGLTATLIASDANATPEFAEAANLSNSPADAVQVLTPAEAHSGADAIPPQSRGLSILAAAAIESWTAAASAAGSNDPAKIAAALSAAPVATQSMGEISFDANGDARLPSFTAARLVAGQWSHEMKLAR